MKAIGIILAGGNNDKLGELTSRRATSAMPVGGCYRCIDFPLSNMSNSGVSKVAVITQYNSRSLHDHMSSAKWWDLGRKHGGLFIFTPYLSVDNSFWFRGTADSIYQNITFLKRSNEPYVILASGNAVYKMDYNEALRYHAAKDAEVTIVYKKRSDDEDPRNFGILEMDDDKRVLDLEEKPLDIQGDDISMGIYVINRTLLIKLLEATIPEDRYDLVKDILVRYRKKLKIYGYQFDGYWKSINGINAYYDCNMDFLNKDVRDMFTRRYPYIDTKLKDEPPAKYNIGAHATDCLVGNGSILNGHINHSILFRKVFTGENTTVRDSIIMEGTYIGNNCVVEHAIFDKEVVLSDGKQVIGTPGKPVILSKGTVV